MKTGIQHSETGTWKSFRFCLLVLTTILSGIVNNSFAVPSFARQTGMPCSSCHTVFPALTAFGREFKLNGYTLTGGTTIESNDEKERSLLKISGTTPLGGMFQTSFTHLSTKLPETQNDNIEFPQQMSLFYSGIIAKHLGAFIQLTYSGQDGTIGFDNTDIRYSNNATLGSKQLIYGVTLNNNPTVQDAWNSIPAWRFPYATSGVAPTPAASPMIDGALAQQVVGIGAYAYYNSFLYLEGSIYRSAQQGAPAPPGPASTGVIKGVAPYWRLALQHKWDKHYLEIGTLGMMTRLYPMGVSGQTDKYTDIGVDAQYELPLSFGSLTIRPSYTWETQKLNATFDSAGSMNLTNNLNSFRISGELFFKKGLGLSLGYFSVTGSTDNIIYQAEPIAGSKSGSPDNSGLVGEVSYLPWQNVKLSLQYIMYNKYNGEKNDYDGFGRSAANNNTLYLLAWINF